MDQRPDFHIEQTWDDKTNFIQGPITITVGGFSHVDGQHKITNPQSANAQFMCRGKLYLVTNATAIPTIEEWYLRELLPKVQMLNLLESPATL